MQNKSYDYETNKDTFKYRTNVGELLKNESKKLEIRDNKYVVSESKEFSTKRLNNTLC